MGMFDFLGPIVQGAADIGSTLLTNKQNVDLWHESQQYNSPVEQMRRLKAAGLNPNLVYGHGAVATGGNPPTMSSPNVDVMSRLQQRSSIDQTDAVTRNLERTGKLIEAQTAGAQADAWAKRRENKVFADTDKLGYSLTSKDPSWAHMALKAIDGAAKALRGGLFQYNTADTTNRRSRVIETPIGVGKTRMRVDHD